MLSNKCINCNYCEPNGIGVFGEPECMKYKEECETALLNCDLIDKKVREAIEKAHIKHKSALQRLADS